MADYTTTDLDNIRDAIAAGVLRARIGDTLVEYRTLADLIAIRTIIEQSLADDPAQSGRNGRAWAPACGKAL